MSGSELALHQARERALQVGVGKVLTKLDEALDQLATSPRADWKEAARQIGIIGGSPAFFEFAARIPRDQMRERIAEHLLGKNPELSPKDVEALTSLAMNHLDQSVARGATERMREMVATKLTAAAESFRTTAGSPDELKRLADRLARLERRGASDAERAAASVMRAGLGLDGDQPASPSALKDAMLKRAKLMESEGEAVRHAGDTTLFRRLLTHDVGEVFKKESGLQPGSWAAEGVAATRARGVSDEETLKTAKLMTSLAFAAVTAGAGAGVLAGMGAAAAANAPGVAMAWQSVDSAAAGASAGTAAPDAEATARTNAQVATGEAGAAVLLAGAVGKLVHAFHLATPGAEVLAHVVGEAGGHKALEKAAHPFEKHPQAAGGEDAVARSRKY